MTAEPRILGLPVKWARATLIISLALNFLAIGLISGASVQTAERRGGSRNFLTEQILELTGEDRQADVKAVLRPPREFYVKRRAQRDQEWAGLAQSLEQSPFEAITVEQIFIDMRTSRDASRAMSYGMLAEALQMMTDDERATLATRIRTHLAERKKRREKK
ncbi:MAG: hypothetical protein AAF367_06000 [Pseudomonadota bacterium]